MIEGKHPRMSNPRMSNPKMFNPGMSNPNAKMSNRVLIRTVLGESTWNDINTSWSQVLLCISLWADPLDESLACGTT